MSAIVDGSSASGCADGGWNCEAENGSVRSSFHTTIDVLDGLLAFERATGGSAAVREARRSGEAYLLERGLFRRQSTGEVVDPAYLELAFPYYWRYDVLRALDHFRGAGADPDPRLAEAVEIVRSQAAARWPVVARARPSGSRPLRARSRRRCSRAGGSPCVRCGCSTGGTATRRGDPRPGASTGLSAYGATMRDGTASWARTVGQVALGATLAFAGASHLTFQREEFRAQVPPWVPLDTDVVVLASGVIEIALGGALLSTWRQPRRAAVGAIVAAFFVAVFPGNIAQFTERRDAFGLDTDAKRFVRLLFQPALVAWAVAATDARRVLVGAYRARARPAADPSRRRRSAVSGSRSRLNEGVSPGFRVPGRRTMRSPPRRTLEQLEDRAPAPTLSGRCPQPPSRRHHGWRPPSPARDACSRVRRGGPASGSRPHGARIGDAGAVRRIATAMAEHPWQIQRLDLDAYLARIGVRGRRARVAALDQLLEAHVRTFTFDNIDVLLEQHRGVASRRRAVQVRRSWRGGYCFEHATLFAAALERLGYDVSGASAASATRARRPHARRRDRDAGRPSMSATPGSG